MSSFPQHPKILAALDLAAVAHASQRRKYLDVPYIVHPVAVAIDVGVRTQWRYPTVVAAALMHDVVEDSHFTLADVRSATDAYTSRLVEFLTDVEPGNRAQRKAATAERLREAPWEAKLIKCCDLIDNARTIRAHDAKFWPVFRDEARYLVDVMHDGVRNDLVFLPVVLALGDASNSLRD